MTIDAGVGRLLIASLHQGLADVAPARLPFYEHWLTPPGLGDIRFGVAALHAVLSFLRREGRPAYEQVMRRAGQYSGEWAHAGLSPVRQGLVRRLPRAWRARWALASSRTVVSQTFRGSTARIRLARGVGTMEIRGSIFCVVRETAAWPMCSYYSAAIERFLECFGIDAEVAVSECRASGGAGCTMTVTVTGARDRAGAGTPRVELAR